MADVPGGASPASRETVPQLEKRFESEAAAVIASKSDRAAWEDLRLRWIGRKQGIVRALLGHDRRGAGRRPPGLWPGGQLAQGKGRGPPRRARRHPGGARARGGAAARHGGRHPARPPARPRHPPSRSPWSTATWRRSSPRSVSASPKGRRSRTTSTTSRRSTSRTTIRRATRRTPSSWRTGSSCCAPTRRRCRSAPCCRGSRRSASSVRAGCSASTTTCATRRCSTRSNAWRWPRGSRSAISRGRSKRSYAPLLAGHQDPPAAELLPLHRAVGGGGRDLPVLQGRGVRRLLRQRLDGDPRLRHGGPAGACRSAASIPSATPGSPSAWASTGWR